MSVAEDIQRPLRRIRRRMFAVRLLRNASFDLLLSSCILALLIALDRALLPGLFTWKVVAGILIASTFLTLVRTGIWGRTSLLDAAVLADSRLALKERISSAIYTREAKGLEEGLVRLLEEDAVRSLHGAVIPERFPVRFPRRAAWILVPLVLSGALLLWVPSLDLLGAGGKKQALASEKEAAEKEKKELDEKLAEMIKKAEEKKLPDAKNLLALLAQEQKPPKAAEAADPRKTENGAGDPRKEALVEMTRREDVLKKGLEDKKLEPLKEALKQLQSLDLKSLDMTKKLQEALKDGDFEKSKQEMDKLKQELKDLASKKQSELTPEEKAKLAKLSQELSKLSKDSKSMSKLSNALSKASSQLAQGSLSESIDSLERSKDDLETLSKLADEMDLLDQALDLVQLSKEELADLKSCPECGKPYCPDCGKPQCSCKPGNGKGQCQGKSGGTCSGSGKGKGQGRGAQAAKAGAAAGLTKGNANGKTGPNPGQGSGERDGGTPEDTTFQRERIAAQGLDPRGVPISTMTVDGPSLTGEAKILKGAALEEAVRQLSDEVEKEPLPIEHREQIQRFHDLLLRGGEGEHREVAPGEK